MGKDWKTYAASSFSSLSLKILKLHIHVTSLVFIIKLSQFEWKYYEPKYYYINIEDPLYNIYID